MDLERRKGKKPSTKPAAKKRGESGISAKRPTDDEEDERKD